jgi:hypothetical protein
MRPAFWLTVSVHWDIADAPTWAVVTNCFLDRVDSSTSRRAGSVAMLHLRKFTVSENARWAAIVYLGGVGAAVSWQAAS